jgi:hypothetical protein
MYSGQNRLNREASTLSQALFYTKLYHIIYLTSRKAHEKRRIYWAFRKATIYLILPLLPAFSYVFIWEPGFGCLRQYGTTGLRLPTAIWNNRASAAYGNYKFMHTAA